MLDNRNYQYAAWGCIAAVAAGTAWELFQADWSGVLFLGVFLIAAILFVSLRRRLPALFSFLFALAALINGAGWVFDFWDRVTGWDPIAHGFTTFAGALAVGFLVFHSSTLHFRDHRWSYAVTIAAYGLALGGLWEMFEWMVGVEQSYQGVVLDLTMDFLGGMIAGGVAAWAVENQPREQLSA